MEKTSASRGANEGLFTGKKLLCGENPALNIPGAVLYKALGKQYHFSLQSIYFPVAVGISFSWESFSESVKPPALTGHRCGTPELLLPGRDVSLLSFCPSLLLSFCPAVLSCFLGSATAASGCCSHCSQAAQTNCCVRIF